MSENVTRCIQRLPELFSRNENPTSPIAGNRRGSVRRQKNISKEKSVVGASLESGSKWVKWIKVDERKGLIGAKVGIFSLDGNKDQSYGQESPVEGKDSYTETFLRKKIFEHLNILVVTKVRATA